MVRKILKSPKWESKVWNFIEKFIKIKRPMFKLYHSKRWKAHITKRWQFWLLVLPVKLLSRFYFNEVCMEIASFASGITVEDWKTFTRVEWTNALKTGWFQFYFMLYQYTLSLHPFQNTVLCVMCMCCANKHAIFNLVVHWKACSSHLIWRFFLCCLQAKLNRFQSITIATICIEHLPHPVPSQHVRTHFTKICYLSYFFFLSYRNEW